MNRHVEAISKFLDVDASEVEAEFNLFDFEVGDYRFINRHEIDGVMITELLSDLYVLGCCQPWFIAECVEALDTDDVELMQTAEAYEALGKLMAKDIDLVQERMVRADGYGHHFGIYDGNEHEVGDYYAFKIN